jgi:hypothetical protein
MKKKRKPASKQTLRTDGNIYFGVRIPRPLVERLRQRAATDQRTLGITLSRILNEALDRIETEERAEK